MLSNTPTKTLVKQRALFLDRDGVINLNHGYVHKVEQVEWVSGIFDLVKAANDAGYLVLIVTNQSGIARGYYSESSFLALMDWMQARFSDKGARIDKVYYCPHHPDYPNKYPQENISNECACRKPNIGMIEQALCEYPIDLSQSVMVGDKAVDMQMAIAAGIAKAYLLNQTTEFDCNTTTKHTQIKQIPALSHIILQP